MGLRSWMTRLEEPGDWEFFKKALKINPYAYGLNYVIDITAEIPLLPQGIWVAWSGDGGASLNHMPALFVERTILLDNLFDEYPYDPMTDGKMLKSKQIEKLLEERCDGLLFLGIFDED